jgi:hypothetical protein
MTLSASKNLSMMKALEGHLLKATSRRSPGTGKIILTFYP